MPKFLQSALSVFPAGAETTQIGIIPRILHTKMMLHSIGSMNSCLRVDE